MKPYNMFYGYVLAFFSPKFYRQVATTWFGRSFFYLFILLAIFWAILAVAGAVRLAGFLPANQINAVAQQMPMIQFEKGVAATKGKKPVYIYLPGKKKQLLAIIDTHKKVRNVFQTQAIFLMSDKVLYVRQMNAHYKKYPFSKDHTGLFGPKQFLKLANGVKFVLVPFIAGISYILLLTISYGLSLLYALILGIFGKAISKHRLLDYKRLYSLGLVVNVPAVIVTGVLAGLQWVTSGLLLTILYLVISIAYFVFGVKKAGVKPEI